MASTGRHRAHPSGIILNVHGAAIVKGMLARGDRQHDVAAWFGVNGGRIAEIASGERFQKVAAADSASLPPPGPYPCGRDAIAALQAVLAAREALSVVEQVMRQYSNVT